MESGLETLRVSQARRYGVLKSCALNPTHAGNDLVIEPLLNQKTDDETQNTDNDVHPAWHDAPPCREIRGTRHAGCDKNDLINSP
jgi:hypothetical protein